MALGGIGAVIILLVWGIIATLPKKEDGREEEVRLRSEIKDNFTQGHARECGKGNGEPERKPHARWRELRNG